MSRLPIVDCRLPIARSATGRGLPRSGHDRSQLVGLIEQVRELAHWQEIGLAKQFDPKRRLVGFFLHQTHFHAL